MRHTNLTMILGSKLKEIEMKLLEVKLQFRTIKKSAIEFQLTHLIFLDMTHARAKGNTGVIEKNLDAILQHKRKRGER